MLLDEFLENILDVPLSASFRSQVVVGNEVRLNIMIEHPLSKLHALFCRIWNYVYKTYPTRLDFQDFLQQVTQSPWDQTPLVSRESAQKIVQSWKPLSFGIPINVPQLTQNIDQWIAFSNQETFILDTVREKWKHRFMHPYPVEKNLVDAYVHMRKLSLAKQTDIPTTTSSIDMFSTLNVDVSLAKVSSLWWTEKIQYVLYQNIYFLMKIASSPCVAIDDDMEEDDPYVIKALHGIIKNSKKRVVVFSNVSLKSLQGILQVPFHSSLWGLLPHISPWFLFISNDNSPSIQGIARESENNVYWSRMADEVQSPSSMLNYNRRLTDEPIDTKDYLITPLDEFWKVHMGASCPYHTSNPSNNMLTYLNFLGKYRVKHAANIQALWSQERVSQPKHKIILFDNRPNEMSVLSCIFALLNTDVTWGCTVYTNKKSQSYFQQHLPSYVEVKIYRPMEEPLFDIDVYNNALQTIDLWQSLQEEGVSKVLVIQDDGMLLRPGIDQFLSFDYVGAPWSDTPGNAYIKMNIQPELVGNGGFSLRSVDQMLRICKEKRKEIGELFFHNINRIPEDVYFVKYLVKNSAKVAPKDIAIRFSAEQIIGIPCLGFHKVWAYHPNEVLIKLYDSFLES